MVGSIVLSKPFRLTDFSTSAWRVDFNLALSSFEPLIRGVRSLVDLALASPHPTPARIVFTSSVSVVASQ